MLQFIFHLVSCLRPTATLHLYDSSAVTVVSKLMLLLCAPLKNEFNMKVGRASLHSIVMPHLQWDADTANVIGKTSGRIDRFSVNCYIIRSVINPSETAACRPPDRPRSEEVCPANADTVHIMLMWFCPSSEIYYTCTEDAVALAVNLLLLNVCGAPAENQVPIRQKPKRKVNSTLKRFALLEKTWNLSTTHTDHTGGWLCAASDFSSSAAAALFCSA